MMDSGSLHFLLVAPVLTRYSGLRRACTSSQVRQNIYGTILLLQPESWLVITATLS